MSNINLLQDNSSSNFSLFVDLGNLEQITLQRANENIVQVQQPVNTASCNINEDASFVNDDDDMDVDDVDDDTLKEYLDEETYDENDDDNDDDQSYHDSDSE